MTVNRTIFGFIKWPWVLVFVCGFIVAFTACVLYSIYASPLKSQCIAPVSLYAVKDDNDVVLTRGVYRSFRSGIDKGRVTFTGNIRHFVDDKMVGRPIPVQREVMFNANFSGDLLLMTITGHHRRLGDQSSDRDVQDYIFPQIHPGETGVTSLYLLEGKAVATGTEITPRVLCIN
ncbi:hypothetical protein ACG0Z5_17945 [Scandinavium sp. M-37]|uniref:hypothetical protein n=1 Tax=Scandinavium sp. M-37 TaxID=3373077 RepID=UPI0037451F00